MKFAKILVIAVAAAALSMSVSSCAKKAAVDAPAPGYVEYGK
tara:strand:+ start:9122 stop:9247 length:126 start_codon:yes stop_codon:yes gene_type:complete